MDFIQDLKRTVTIDPCALGEVLEEDKVLVENVIYAIQACKYPAQLCSTWSVTCTNSHYIVNGTLPLDFDVSMVDMELIHSVSPLRINCISIVQTNHGAQNKLQVKISNCRQRLQLTEGDFIVTRKKRRFFE